jgi:uncharacterized OB-fold protein
MTWAVSFVGLIIVFLGFSGLVYYSRAKQAYADAKVALVTAKKLPDDIAQQKFAPAKEHATQFQQELAVVKKDVERMQGLAWWPYVGRQYKAVRTLISAGEDGGQALGTLVDFLDRVFAPFSQRGKVNLASITRQEKGEILANIAAQGDELLTAKNKIDAAAVKINSINTAGLIGPLAEAIGPLKDQIPLITQGLNEAVPATNVFPAVLGYPTAKNYLFLMENNSELRPGGGFIGTYGLMTLASGEIASLKTDNSYNIDRAAEKMAKIAPPEAIRTYLKVNAWYFRDSNWSPDFPSSAAQALYMYQREGGAKNLDGVIAITPTFIANMLKLVGSITVDGIQFNSENFVERLQYEVEKGYLRAGIKESDRKDIIGDLSSVLVQRLMSLPLTQWKDLFLSLSQQLGEKQVLFYLKNESLQNIVMAQNWGGAIAENNNNDYLMIADANLASLKTDQVMLRRYDYAVTPDDQGAVATLTVHYQNTGKFDWKTTRYNTYVRIYVPNGSTLIEASGAQLRPMSKAVGQVTTTTELGKTVFAAFKSIEPGTQSDLVLKYRLPKNVAEQLASQQYKLIWQKEPGMIPPDMNISITNSKKAQTIDGVDNLGQIRKDTASFTGRLDRDRTIIIGY